MGAAARRDELDVFRSTRRRTLWNEPCLVVIDYAAARATQIELWLRSLLHADEKSGHAPLRLLLIERTGGDGIAWWRDIFDRSGAEGEAIRELLGNGAPLSVGPLSDANQRYGVFAAAFEQASGASAPARNTSLDQALSQASLGGEPLFLAMFGLTAARQGLTTAKSLSADEIALKLAEEELDRIEKIWKAHLPIARERKLHAHLAAVATLCGGLTEVEADVVIAMESAALKQAIPPDQTGAARAALHAALPGEAGGIAPILPDILGEAAIIRAFQHLPDKGRATVRRATQQRRRAVAEVVVRTCQDFLIRGQRLPLDWLKAMQADAVELAETLLCAITPEHGDVLRAAVLNNLSNRRSDLGRREEALAAVEEAVAISRDLAAARPDAFLPDLAGALNNLSGRLSALDRHEKALAAVEEAVTLRRNLAAAQSDASLRYLAVSLNTLSVVLSDLGRREEALAAVEEAVTLRRNLAAAQSDAFLPDLPRALNTLSIMLSGLGRIEEALVAMEEAVGHYRSLAAARPDAFLPDLAVALNNLSNRLSGLGRREEALAAVEEAVGHYRRLAAARPLGFAEPFATTLRAMADRVDESGDAAMAVNLNLEALKALEPLFHRHPAALAEKIVAMMQTYIERCDRVHVAADEETLLRIAAILVQTTPHSRQEQPEE